MRSPGVPWHERETRSGSVVARLLAALTVLLIALAPLGRVAHLVIVPHEYCAEHGELVHVEGDGEGAHSHGDSAKLASIESVSSESDDAHEHCALAGSSSRDIAVVASSRAVVLAGDASSSPRVGPAESEPGDARLILLIAPKASPPV